MRFILTNNSLSRDIRLLKILPFNICNTASFTLSYKGTTNRNAIQVYVVKLDETLALIRFVRRFLILLLIRLFFRLMSSIRGWN